MGSLAIGLARESFSAILMAFMIVVGILSTSKKTDCTKLVSSFFRVSRFRLGHIVENQV